MPIARIAAVVSAFAALLTAQETPAGVAPAWDVRAAIKSVVNNADRYRLLVDQLKIDDWIAKGAPETFTRHQALVRTEVGHLATVGRRLADSPERLSLALDVMFRLQTLESFTVALSEGTSRYQDPQLGRSLNDLLAQNEAARSMLRQYVMDLSVTKEQEFAVAEQEAQRCQATLNRNPLAPASRNPMPRQQVKK